MRVLDADIAPRRTADGHIVKRGDVIWVVKNYGVPTRKTVTRTVLRVWMNWSYWQNAYVSQYDALQRALVECVARREKAKNTLRTETKNVERLRALFELAGAG